MKNKIRTFFKDAHMTKVFVSDRNEGGRTFYNTEITLEVMKQFAKWWLDETQKEEIAYDVKNYGLCSNFFDWFFNKVRNGDVEYVRSNFRNFEDHHKISHFMNDLFVHTVGEDDDSGNFDPDYPFGGVDVYDEELQDHTMHTNELRIGFINDILKA